MSCAEKLRALRGPSDLRASSSLGPISMRMQDAYVADALHYVVNAANLTISVLNDRTMAVASK